MISFLGRWAAMVALPASGLVLGGRPRGLLPAMVAPRWKISPPHTPHGSTRSSAPAGRAMRSGHCWQHALVCVKRPGDHGIRHGGPATIKQVNLHPPALAA